MRAILSTMILSLLLMAAGAFGQGSNVDNVVILLDASGSMNAPMGGVRRIDAAKTAMKEVVKTLPKTTHVGLLVFSAANARGWVYPLGPRDDATLNAAIDRPEPGDGTPLGTYMKLAADRLLEARKAQFGYGTYRLLVVTDGEANQEPAHRVSDYTKDIIGRGIVVDVIGVQMAGDHTLANRVHSYRRADDPESLKKAIRAVFAEVDKPRNDQAGEDAFAEIAALPDEVARVAINAFTSTGNQPMGEKPTAIPPIAEASTPAPPAQPPQEPVHGTGARSGRGGPMLWGILCAVVVFLLIRKARR